MLRDSSNRPFSVWAIALNENNIFAGTENGGIFLSTDNGDNWTAKNQGLKYLNVWSLALIGKNIFAGTMGGGIFLSDDNGESWLIKNTGMPMVLRMKFAIRGDTIYAGTLVSGVFRAKLSDFGISAVKEKNQNIENIIYPNPASDFININSANIIGKEISIYDMLGNKLITATAESPETRINIESLPIGVYFIKMGGMTKMFVKE
jgi:hypothetical protein